MISRQEAERLVYERINVPDPYWADRPEMIVVRMQEHLLGWLAFWDSRPHHETGEFRFTILGNTPYLVSHEDGTMFPTGTAPPFEERVRKAEHQLRTYLQTRVSATLHRDTYPRAPANARKLASLSLSSLGRYDPHHLFMRRAPLVILVPWLVLCVGYEFQRVATFMAQPASGDLYAHSWGFQFVVFVVFRFGFWVAALLFALAIEGYWHRRSRPVA